MEIMLFLRFYDDFLPRIAQINVKTIKINQKT